MKHLLFISLLSISLFSCKKHCLDGYKSVSFEKANIDMDCLFFNDSSYTINDDATYQLLLGPCKGLPEIDFSQHTLIGKFNDERCYEACVKIKDVCLSTADNQVLIKLKGSSKIKCGCKKEYFTMHWLLIPKTNSGFTIDYEYI